jgi:hypothetical protein
VELSCQYVETAGFESVYLLGSFGVGVCDESAVLTALPSKLAVGDVTQQGLPFYGGAITYELGCAVPHALRSPGRRFALRAPGMSAACALAVCTGDTMPDTITLDLSAREDCSDAERLIAWAPYEADVTKLVSEDKGLALRLYLTRRNTFGPLHQLPVHTPGYGPGNWVTEGDAFSDAYVLWPSGLLSPPQIIVREP